jgi:hypothetical protein
MIEINPKYVEGSQKRFKHPLRIKGIPSPYKRRVNEYMKLGEFK